METDTEKIQKKNGDLMGVAEGIKNWKKPLIWSILSFLLFDFGISLQIKARVGQSMFTALAVTLSDASNLKVGTILNILNLVFFVLLLLIRRTKLSFADGVMVIATLVYGYVVNFFVYVVLAGFHTENYFISLMIFSVGVLLSAINLGIILACDFLKFPLEAFCIVVKEKTGKSLTWIRMFIDVVFFVGTMALVIFAGQTLNIREGTVISFFLLSYGMGKSYEFTKKHLEKSSVY